MCSTRGTRVAGSADVNSLGDITTGPKMGVGTMLASSPKNQVDTWQFPGHRDRQHCWQGCTCISNYSTKAICVCWIEGVHWKRLTMVA